MVKKFISVFLIISTLLLYCVPMISNAAVNVSGWNITYNNITDKDAVVSVDKTEKYSGDASLKIQYKAGIQDNVYMQFSQNVSVEKGKSYKFGVWIKANNARRVIGMTSWKNRISLLPISGTTDWTLVEFVYHSGQSGSIPVGITIDDKTKEVWLDDFYFSEVLSEGGLGENLLKNPNFDTAIIVTDESDTDSGYNEIYGVKLYNELSAKEKFGYSDYIKIFAASQDVYVEKVNNITIDGLMNDWQGPSSLLPVKEENYCKFTKIQENPITAEYQYGFDDKYFYLVAAVKDDVHYSLGSWRTDSVQASIADTQGFSRQEFTFARETETGTNKVEGGGEVFLQNPILFESSIDSGKIVYEIAIPWEPLFGEKPDEILFDFIVNDHDNDENGRAYCLEVTPGISLTKDTSFYQTLILDEQPNELQAFVDIPEQVFVDEEFGIKLYAANTTDEAKTISIKCTELSFEKEVTIEAKTVLNTQIKGKFNDLGTKDVEVFVGDNIIKSSVYVGATKDYLIENVTKLQGYVKELKVLLDKCAEKGISTDYEEIDYNIITDWYKYNYIQNDAEFGWTDIATFELEKLTEMYEETKTKLQNYLDGKEKPKIAPKYVTSEHKYDNKVITAEFDVNGKIERRPAFFVGTMSSANYMMDRLPKYGFNAVQNEMSISNSVVKKGNVPGWAINFNGNAKGDAKIVDGMGVNESRALVINKTTDTANNRFIQLAVNYMVPAGTYEYEIGLDFKGKSGSGWIGAKGWDGDKRISFAGGREEWQRLSKEFTYTSENDSQNQLLIVVPAKSEELCIDNVYIKRKGKNENLAPGGDFEYNVVTSDTYPVESAYILGDYNFYSQAQKNNLSNDLLLGIHYSSYLTGAFPELKKSTTGYFSCNLYDPLMIEAVKVFVKSVIESVKNYKSITSVCLSNEPAYNLKSLNPETQPQGKMLWVNYLKEIYNNDIAELNRICNTEYASFEAVEFPDSNDRKNPLFYDYMMINAMAFSGWHKIVADAVHEVLPGIPVHAKQFDEVNVYDRETYPVHGTFYEMMSEFSQLNGCDSYAQYKDEANTIQSKLMGYDVQQSINEVPVINSEDHNIVVADRTLNDELRKHVYSDVFQGALHGRSISTIWKLTREYAYAGDIEYTTAGLLFKPDTLKAIGYANYDINRLSNEIYAFVNSKDDVAMLWSEGVRITSKEYLNAAYKTYEALTQNGQQVQFVTEKTIGELDDYKLLVLPYITNIDADTLNAIKVYIEKGGKVIILNQDSLNVDFHNQPNNEAVVKYIKDNSKIIQTESKGVSIAIKEDESLFDIFNRELESIGLMNVKLLDSNTNKPIQGIEWSCAEYKGKLLLNMCNYDWSNSYNVKVMIDGKEVASMRDLIEEKELNGTYELATHSPALIELMP